MRTSFKQGILRHTACLSLLLWTAAATAQTNQGRITGRVLDPAEAVVAEAEVVMVNEDTGVATRVTSNEVGVYVVPSLQPGRYRMTASKEGFKRQERKGLVVATADVLGLDIHLELGSLSDSVVVNAEAPLLESTTGTVSQFMDSRAVQEMPLSGRRALELVRLAGGVVFVEYSASNRIPSFSLGGGRVQNQMAWLDGGSIQNMRLGTGQVSVDPPVEVVREFRILQNSYSAEYGGSAGGIVISTTKSGTNQFHGSAFEFFRNDAMDAAGFFAPVEGTRKIRAPLRYNLFGATLGGPVVRNRTHFFAGYEGTRRSDGSTQILTVPTAEQRRGDFSQTLNTQGRLIPIYNPATTRRVGTQTVRDPFPGNIIPSGQIDPVARQMVEFWPAPNRPPVNSAGAQNFIGNRSQKFTRDNVTAKVDHVTTDNNRAYFRLIYNKDPFSWTTNYPRPEADPTNNFNPGSRQSSYLFADTHIFRPNLISEFRYAFGNDFWHVRSAGLGSNVVEQIGLKGAPSGAFPQMQIAGFSTLGSSNERAQFPIRQHQIVNNWTYIRGKHQVKYGAELRRSSSSEVNRPSISGQYRFANTGTGLPGSATTGNTLSSFMVGFVNGLTLRQTERLTRSSWYLAGFLQDDWTVTPALTLNIGLRWETDTPMTDAGNAMNSFDMHAVNPVSGTPGVVKFAGVNGWPRQPYRTDWNNFGPRFGFAWRPAGSERWVVRGGYGVAFDHPFGHGAPNQASLGFERSAGLSSPDNGVTPAFYLGHGVPGATLQTQSRDDSFGAVRLGAAPNTNVTFFEQSRRTGYAQQFSLGLQRQLNSGIVLEVSYMGNLGRKMPLASLNINQVRPELMAAGNAQARRPFPQFNNVMLVYPSMGTNNYHAGVARVEKRFSAGLSFLGSYTWSRNLGNLDQVAGIGEEQIFQDYYNRRLDKGPLSIDIVHRFAWSSVYDLPAGKGRRWLTGGIPAAVLGGWTVGSIATMQSGGPFTVTMQSNTTNSFSAGGLRANVLRDGNLPPGQRTVNRWFDVGAFQAPPAFAFGNAGRGILRADGRVNFDFSVNKNFGFGEQNNAQFRVEFFNAFNHPDFGVPGVVLGTAAVGTVTGATSPRTLQLGLRLNF